MAYNRIGEIYWIFNNIYRWSITKKDNTLNAEKSKKIKVRVKYRDDSEANVIGEYEGTTAYRKVVIILNE